MKPLQRAAARLRDAGSIPVLAALLVVAVSAPLAAGDHNPPSDSSDMGRAAEPRSEPDSWTPPPSNDSGGSVGDDSGGSVGDDSSGSAGDDSGGSAGDDSGSSSDDSDREVIVVAQKDYSEGRSAQPRSDSGSRPSYSPPSSSGGNSGGSSGGNSGGSSGGSDSRTARPRSGSDDGSHQQRPRTGSRDDWRGGHGGGWYGGGGGYYGGGYYGGYYSPYHRYYYWGPYFGWGLWGGWWGDDYYGYYGYNQPRYYRDRYDRERTAGALDIDVSPGKTEVWIDGRYTGTADDFDGFPQYLWLDKGVYDLALYREGYRTIARQITIYGGTVISIDDRMQRGESVKPQDLVTKTHERRDERVRSEEERREEIARRDRDGRDDMEDWRDRARRRMEERGRYEQNDRDEDRDSERRDSEGNDGGSGHLRVEILPADSSVYLDGRFVGTGVDLERIRQGLRVEPGEHRIAVVRPGHKSEEQEFTVSPGQEVELEIELESME